MHIKASTPKSWRQGQRAILNFTPRGEFSPQGWTLSPCSPPGVNNLYSLEEWRGEQRISPPGDNFTPRIQNSPLRDNFAPGGSKDAPRGEVKNGPQSSKPQV
jgi:hypothetical protein